MAVISNSDIQLTTDIGQVLNSAGGSVDINQPLTFFTESAKINMYSKKKPMHRPELFCQDFDSTMTNYLPNWWQGVDGNCGLIPKLISSYSQLPDMVDGDKNGWKHQLPNGGENSPYRLGDFCGYDTDAKGLVEGFSVPKNVTSQGSGATMRATIIATPQETNPISLTFADFPVLKNYFLGLFIKNKSTGQSFRATSEETVGNGAWYVDLNTQGINNGNWDAFIFLSSIKINQNEQDGGGAFYTIPNTKAVPFSVVTSTTSIYAYATRLNGQNLDVYVYVTSNGDLNFTNNTLYIKYKDNDITSLLPNEFSRSIQNFSVPSGVRTLVFNEQIHVSSADLFENCKLIISLNSGEHVGEGSVIALPTVPANL